MSRPQKNNFPEAAESLDEMKEAGNRVIELQEGDCFTEQSSGRVGCCSFSINTTEVINVYELFIVTNSHCYWFLSLFQPGKHRWGAGQLVALYLKQQGLGNYDLRSGHRCH